MEAAPQQIIIYTDPWGNQPFVDWLEAVEEGKTRRVIKARLARVELGNFGYCRILQGGLLELKIDFGPGYRIYLGRLGPNKVVLLLGGDKNSQAKDIDLASRYWENYRRQRETF